MNNAESGPGSSRPGVAYEFAGGDRLRLLGSLPSLPIDVVDYDSDDIEIDFAELDSENL